LKDSTPPSSIEKDESFITPSETRSLLLEAAVERTAPEFFSYNY
jgi:hypothetical protein